MKKPFSFSYSLRCPAVLLLLMLLLPVGQSYGQRLRYLWPGLTQPQPADELPRGKTPIPQPERKEKENRTTRMAPSGPMEWTITDGWEMADAETVIMGGALFDPSLDTGEWYNAAVPGTVLTTLVEQDVCPDPYYGLNNLYISENICRTDWWYRCIFEVPAEARGKRMRLLFNGVNYMAEVYVNGVIAGCIEGAFTRKQLDVTELIDPLGENVLAVRVMPPRNPGFPHEQSMVAGQGLNGGALSLDGPTFISSVGWDWIPGIRDRNMGIWQDVKFFAGGHIIVGDPVIITDLPLPDTTRAEIKVRVPLKNTSGAYSSGSLKVRFEGAEAVIPLNMPPFAETEITIDRERLQAFAVKNPRLWWPNGYGNQELYDISFETVDADGKHSDCKTLRFGIRELSYEMMAAVGDENVRLLYTPVNNSDKGVPVFDYVDRVQYSKEISLPRLVGGMGNPALERLPADDPVGPYFVLRVNGRRIFCRGGNWGMDDGMKRVSRERLEPYFRLHKEANFNIIRNWTGESTEETFYELCDEYGMLVWNDFWITTDDTVEPNDAQLFMRNATDVVRRFRHHPSIAVWCPRNEGYAPKAMERLLPAMLAKEDPTRHYHGQSRFLNMDSSGPWGYFDDPAEYYRKNAKGFITEIGTYAVPTAATIRKFIGEEDLWPINDVWAYHDLHHTTQNFEGFMKAVERYGKPQSMDAFSAQAQLVCYDAWRAIMEAWNSRMWNTATGQVLWMSHPAWPSMIWQTYTYDYETPGSYFAAKKACEPLHVQMNLDDRSVVVINNTLSNYRALTASVEVVNPADGKILHSEKKKVSTGANSLTACFTPSLPDGLPALYLVRTLLKEGGKTVSVNDYWVAVDDGAHGALSELPTASVTVGMKSRGGKTYAEVHNASRVTAVAVKLNAVDDEGGIILPAYFSDGYFNLLPGERREIEVSVPGREYKVAVSGYNL